MNNASFFTLILLGCGLVAGQVHAAIENDDCTESGYKCSSDCTKVQICVANRSPLRGFDLITVEECNEPDTYCDEESFKCTNTSTCLFKRFDCASTGSYPDPIDCTKHRTCIVGINKTEIASQKCPDKYAYDPLSGSCLFKLTHEVCTKGPVPKCTGISLGAVKFNPSIWYICVRDPETGNYYHRLSRCSNGKFDTITQGCKPAF